jgi:hypothetical protein
VISRLLKDEAERVQDKRRLRHITETSSSFPAGCARRGGALCQRVSSFLFIFLISGFTHAQTHVYYSGSTFTCAPKSFISQGYSS